MSKTPTELIQEILEDAWGPITEKPLVAPVLNNSDFAPPRKRLTRNVVENAIDEDDEPLVAPTFVNAGDEGLGDGGFADDEDNGTDYSGAAGGMPTDNDAPLVAPVLNNSDFVRKPKRLLRQAPTDSDDGPLVAPKW